LQQQRDGLHSVGKSAAQAWHIMTAGAAATLERTRLWAKAHASACLDVSLLRRQGAPRVACAAGRWW
jgi:hypothetical protein